eukprot:751922-Hanusia_phi.AAC.2
MIFGQQKVSDGQKAQREERQREKILLHACRCEGFEPYTESYPLTHWIAHISLQTSLQCYGTDHDAVESNSDLKTI